MNKLLTKLLKKLKVKVIKIDGFFPGVDDEKRIIYVPRHNETTTMRTIKAACGRPIGRDFTIAHELGHILLEDLEWYSKPWFKKLFGDYDQEYEGNDALIRSPFLRKRKGFVTKYAQTHPAEDWADCFGLFITEGDLDWGDEVINKKMAWVKKAIEQAS